MFHKTINHKKGKFRAREDYEVGNNKFDIRNFEFLYVKCYIKF